MASQPRKVEHTFLDGGRFEGYLDPKSRAAHGVGKRIFMDGAEYDGEWVHGRMEGQGTMSFGTSNPTLKEYTGKWKRNKFEGTGTLVYRYLHTEHVESYYEGEFKAGKMDGQGVRKTPEGESYQGYWKEDKRNGDGVQLWRDGRKYQGEWKDDKRHGQGKLFRADSTIIYEGQWKNDSYYHGYGESYLENREGGYKGDWKYGKHDGEGSSHTKDGERYEGSWKNGLRHGQGVAYWSGGISYEGHWKDGKREGRGKLTVPEQDCSYDGEWENNNLHGQVELTRLSDGEKFTRNYYEGQPVPENP